MRKNTMNRAILRSILYIIISFYIPCHAYGKELIINSDAQFHFAKQYMDRGEYQKAIVEFERLTYFFPEDENVPTALYLSGICYLKINDYNRAQSIFRKLSTEYPDTPLGESSQFLIGESYYEQGMFEESEKLFNRIIEKDQNPDLKDMAYYRLGWEYLRTDEWQTASRAFNKVSTNSLLHINATDLADKSLLGEELSYKDPVTAGIMAGLLPGSGHFYCNRYRDGIVAFILNGAFIYAAAESFEDENDALGGILAFLELGWYTGNIYSAVNCTHKYNRKVREDFIGGFSDDFDIDFFIGKSKNLGISLKFDF